MHVRPDLQFWGGTTVWMIDVNASRAPVPMSMKNEDTTYSLNWLGNSALVFDRVADTPFYSHARLWTTTIETPKRK